MKFIMRDLNEYVTSRANVEGRTNDKTAFVASNGLQIEICKIFKTIFCFRFEFSSQPHKG